MNPKIIFNSMFFLCLAKKYLNRNIVQKDFINNLILNCIDTSISIWEWAMLWHLIFRDKPLPRLYSIQFTL